MDSQKPIPPFVVEPVLRTAAARAGEKLIQDSGSQLKILYLVHGFFPESYLGTQKFLLNLATMMQKKGHDVNVMTYSSYENSWYDASDGDFHSKEYVYKNISVHAFKQRHPPIYGHWDIENDATGEYAACLLRADRPDVIHIAHGMRVSSVAIAAQRLGIPYVVTLTDFFYLCPNCKLLTSNRDLCAGPEQGEKCRTSCPVYENDIVRRRLQLSERILRDAKAVVAPSWFLGNLFKREFRWLEPMIIPYGIDHGSARHNTRRFDGSDKLVVLFAGQLDVHKGVHVVIDAVRHMKATNILVKIYGSGPPLIEWKLRAKAKGDPRIHFAGVYREDQLGDVLSAVDCVVIPSLWHENNTIVMREALASHIPCIVSDAGGMVEMIQEGKNGFVVRMGDSFGLAELLDRLATNPELLAGAKKDSSAFAVTTVEQEGNEYELVYRDALKDRIV